MSGHRRPLAWEGGWMGTYQSDYWQSDGWGDEPS